MSVRKGVGRITAYAAAVSAGYKGTYKQFCEDQANFAENAAAVRRDKEAAAVSASEAKASETNAAKSAAEAAASVSAGKYVSLYIGEDGHLYMTKTENAEDIDFRLQNGRLVMEVTV